MFATRNAVAKTLATLFVAGSVAMVAAVPAHAADSLYYPSGPQAYVASTDVTEGGWKLCWSEAYDQTSSVESILAGTDDSSVAACDGDLVLITGWDNNDPGTLITVAAAPKADVFTETPINDANGVAIPRAADGWASVCHTPGNIYTNPHLVNGGYWYYTPGCSMGVTPTRDLGEWPGDSYWSDGTQALRISWHMYDSAQPTSVNGGFSLGDHGWLNGPSHFTRAAFTANAPAVETGVMYDDKSALANTGSANYSGYFAILGAFALLAGGVILRRASK